MRPAVHVAVTCLAVFVLQLVPALPASASVTGVPVDNDEVTGVGGEVGASDGTISYDLSGYLDGAAGAPDVSGPPVATPDQPQPPTFTVRYTIIDTAADPDCYRTTSETLVGGSQADADAYAAQQERAFDDTVETNLMNGILPPRRCPTPDPTTVPGVDPTPAIAYADGFAEDLPEADPTIGTAYAITGLRTWLDTRRDTTRTTSTQLFLGAQRFDVTFTATVEATITWGDGTTTVTAARGGAYHDGEPGPDDITHHYVDRGDDVPITVTDTWTIVITVDTRPDLTRTLTYEMDPRTVLVDVREVRSTRDA